MDVFLVPVASERYELYCEEPDEPPAPEGSEPPKGLLRRAYHRFREMLALAEHERRSPPGPEDAPHSLTSRIKARCMRWIAESIAEQRLLWQLRRLAEATLVHPDDLTADEAQQLLRRSLQRDWSRHRFWMIVDALGGLGSVLLILLPGPNIIGYYFLFRIVGHYFSLRGAWQGLAVVAWIKIPSAPLTVLRGVVTESPERREAAVREVALALHLEYFLPFFQRAAVP